MGAKPPCPCRGASVTVFSDKHIAGCISSAFRCSKANCRKDRRGACSAPWLNLNASWFNRGARGTARLLETHAFHFRQDFPQNPCVGPNLEKMWFVKFWSHQITTSSGKSFYYFFCCPWCCKASKIPAIRQEFGNKCGPHGMCSWSLTTLRSSRCCKFRRTVILPFVASGWYSPETFCSYIL